MTLITGPLRTATDAVCAREGVDEAALTRPELLAVIGELDAVRKAADVIMAQAAAQVDRQSRGEAGHAGLAAREGYRSAKELLARTMGGSMAEAQRLVDTGALLADAGSAEEHQATGATPPVDEEPPNGVGDVAEQVPSIGEEGAAGANEPVSPVAEVKAALAKAARQGRVSVDVTALFSNVLVSLPDTEKTRDLFAQALDKAPGLPLHRVRALVWRAQASADPQAWAEREERQHEARAVTVRDDSDGMVTLTAKLTPLAAAPVRAVLDAGVRRAMQMRRDEPGSDPRSPWQMRADLLSDMCQHMLDCDTTTTGVKTTVVVRMSAQELEAGTGVGEIDATAQPVSVKNLRAAAVDAEIIPAILGGEGDILDWGRAKRLFTPTQRLALAERDGGCAWCHAPPSWCEAHHIRWWKHGGRTDLQNGVLLCTRCHHRIHRDRWTIHVTSGTPPDGQAESPGAGADTRPRSTSHASSSRADTPSGRGKTVWFTPPHSVDPTGTPRAGGRARYDIRESELIEAQE